MLFPVLANPIDIEYNKRNRLENNISVLHHTLDIKTITCVDKCCHRITDSIIC